MKISVKLLLITFTVVVSISGVSAFIYYSLTNSLLETQYSKSILNSTSDFAGIIQPLMDDLDNDAARIAIGKEKPAEKLKDYSLDFIFKIVNDSLIDFSSFREKDSIYINRSTRSVKSFVRQNNGLIFRAVQGKENVTYFYGKAVTESFLNRIAEKIRGEIAFVVNDNILELSHSLKNKNYLYAITSSVNLLKHKSNYDITREFLEDSDFMASVFTPKSLSVAEDKIKFLVFNNNTETLQFRSTIKLVIIIIISSGIALSLILILLFTTRIRKQIYLLNEGAQITAGGDLEHRVDVITRDEIGKFGITFNKMLDELSLTKKAEKEFMEFLTMLNQNPSIGEIADAALTKIIKATGLTFGVVYLVEKKEFSIIASHGVSGEFVQPVHSANFYSKAVEEKELIEFVFKENFPEIRTGLASIKIKYLLICPVIYNKEVIAIIELASGTDPKLDVKKYFNNIHDQLAIGMINAKSLNQLEAYIDELKKLNQEYQKQNLQITGQNEKLLELHSQLKEKADELEEKRNQAVQLTLVKSQFLANMSHELKTPLISIIGLTDLTIKEHNADLKMKERLGIVLRNGKKLLNMINNILEFSKFESGRVEVKSEVFLITDLINEIRDNILPLAKEKGLLFNINNISGEALLSTDKTLLERILLNLLFNAVKFTDRGSIELSISFSGKGDAEFKVSDTGIGISEDNQKIIFDEFKQVEEGSTKTYSGAGLGLAISKRYVDMLEGKISVKSRINAGTTFKVALPRVLVELIEGKGNIETARTSAATKEPNIKAVLLSKSDNTKRLLQDYLHNYNISLQHIHSIKELQKLDSKNVNFLFADIDDSLAGIWNAIGKMKKGNKTLYPLIIRMLEDKKIGYGLYVNDIFSGAGLEDAVRSILSITHNGRKIKKLCVLYGQRHSKKNELNSADAVTFYPYTGWDEFVECFAEEKFDAVLIEMLEPGFNSIEFIYNVRKGKSTRNMFVALNLPENVSDEDAITLCREVDNVAISAKYHPMDVLKVIRDRMGLSGEADETETAEEIKEPSIAEIQAPPSKSILIVDDDNDTLFTIGEIISGAGFGVSFAHNGIECLALLEKNKPDLILLDIMMPQMDGFETIKRIRNNYELKEIPVAALTAYEMLDNREVIEKNGFDDLITKPIDSNALVFKIEKLLIEKNEKDISN